MAIHFGAEDSAFWRGVLAARPYAAIILVDSKGSVINLNYIGQRMIEVGRPLYVRNGKIRHYDPSIDNTLQAAVSTKSDFSDQTIIDANRALLKITRIIHPSDSGNALQSILQAEFDQVMVTTERWRRIFKLSPMEMKVALEIINGNSAEEISQKLNIALTTVRTHIRSLHNKCDVHSNIYLTHILTKLCFF